MYFHTGDHVSTTTFYDSPCQKDFVYVANMADNHYLYNEHPFFFADSDGILLSLDQQLPVVSLYNTKDELIDTFTFTFIHECPTSETISVMEKLPEESQLHSNQGYFLIVALLGISVGVVLLKRKERKKHET